MPQERIFTMKEGTEFPKSFAGTTVPINATESLAEQLKVAGASDELQAAIAKLESKASDADKKAIVTQNAVFNQAHVLNVQKSVKLEANKEGATVPGLRTHAAEFKYGTVKVRSSNGAAPKTVKPETVAKAIGSDLLAAINADPKLKALYEAQMASLRPAVADAKATK